MAFSSWIVAAAALGTIKELEPRLAFLFGKSERVDIPADTQSDPDLAHKLSITALGDQNST